MERRIILGPYEFINEHWISREHITEACLRVIEGKIYYPTDYILNEYDPGTRNVTREVTRWVWVEYSASTE
jgi:hypothetical protein